MQLGADLGIAVSLDDAWGKESVAVGRDLHVSESVFVFIDEH